MDQSQQRRWAAASPGGGDIAYRMQSLTYRPIEISLDESVSWQTLVALWLRAIICWFLTFTAFFILWIVVVLSSDSTSTALSGQFPGQGTLALGNIVSFIVFWAVLLSSKIDEPIAEWKALIEDKFTAADSAYAAVYASLGRRSIPVRANAMRVRSDVLSPEIVNNRLVITERSYAAYVSVFAYGTSLYVGWMMWRSRRGATLIGHFVKDLIGGIFGRTGSVNQMLRTERARAMREAVHSAVREGVELVSQGVEVPLAATFGHDVPIQDLRAGQGGAPAGWAPVPQSAPPVPSGPGPGYGG